MTPTQHYNGLAEAYTLLIAECGVDRTASILAANISLTRRLGKHCPRGSERRRLFARYIRDCRNAWDITIDQFVGRI